MEVASIFVVGIRSQKKARLLLYKESDLPMILLVNSEYPWIQEPFINIILLFLVSPDRI